MSSYSTFKHTGFKLNTGAVIPALGLRTWPLTETLMLEDNVGAALKAGYKHIDIFELSSPSPSSSASSSPISVHDAIARGIKTSAAPRENIFLTTKFWNNIYQAVDVEQALDGALHDLGTDYVDLFLLHWVVSTDFDRATPPTSFTRTAMPALLIRVAEGSKFGQIDFVYAYKAMEKLYNSGKAKAIGVSNLSKDELERLLKETEITPAVHQTEMHPWMQQKGWAEFHRENGIHIIHSLPYARFFRASLTGQTIRETLIDTSRLEEIGNKHDNVPCSHIALAWGMAQGHSVIPSINMIEDIERQLRDDFTLDEDDLQKIASVDKNLRLNYRLEFRPEPFDQYE